MSPANVAYDGTRVRRFVAAVPRLTQMKFVVWATDLERAYGVLHAYLRGSFEEPDGQSLVESVRLREATVEPAP